MKLPASVGRLVLALASSASLSAQSSPQPLPVLPPLPQIITPQLATTGRTSLTLETQNDREPFVPNARVTAPIGETLLITGPLLAGGAVQWTKGGRPIAGATDRQLILRDVTSVDVGLYRLATTGSSPSAASQTLDLGIGPPQRLTNLSTRGTIAAGAGQKFTVGFVVGSSRIGKTLLVRAIGPSLAGFGISNPLRAPVIQVFDSLGRPYSSVLSYPAGQLSMPVIIISPPGTPAPQGPLTPEKHLAYALSVTGAFPVPAGSLDVTYLMGFNPGAYTAQVTSADNTGGEVLLEIYEVP